MNKVYSVDKYLEVSSMNTLTGPVESVVTTKFLKNTKVIKTIYYNHQTRTKYTEIKEVPL